MAKISKSSNFKHIPIVGFSGYGLIIGNLFGLFHEIWMQESFQMIGMFPNESFLLLFNHVDPPHFDKFLLLSLLSLSFLGLSILVQFDLPESFDLSFVLLLFQSAFFSGHLLESFLLCQSLEHLLLELLLQESLLLLLFQLCLFMFSIGFL